MRKRDYFDQLWLSADGDKQKYPKGHTPFQRMTRFWEEAGEHGSRGESW